MNPSKLWLSAAALSALIYSFLGFDWGIMHAQRVKALQVHEQPGLLDDIARLTKEKGYVVNVHVTSGGMDEGPEDLPYFHSTRHLSWDKDRHEFLRIYRHYLAWGYSGDLATSFGPLSTMKPRQFNFNPHAFQYGGAFLYPLALALKAASWTGYTHVVADATYYILHPEELYKLAAVGRALCVLMNVIAIVFVYKATAVWKNPKLGLLAAALYCFLPGPICLSREIKPHAYGVTWAVLSLYFAVLFLRQNKDRFWVLSTVGAGLAAGSVPNYGVAILTPFVALCAAPIDKKIKKIIQCMVLFGMVGLATNPYIIIARDILMQEMTSIRNVFVSPPDSWLTPWIHMFALASPWWLSLAAIVSLVFFIAGKDKVSEKLVFSALPIGYTAAFYIASNGNCPPRFSILIYPFLAIFAAWGILQITQKNRVLGIAAGALLLGLTAVKGTANVISFVQDTRGESTVFRAARFVNQLPPQTSLGLLAIPTPGSFPPIPFHRYRLTTFPDFERMQQAPDRDLPDYMIITDDAVPDLPRYKLEIEFLPFSFYTRELFKPAILSPGTPAWRFRIYKKYNQ